jgi:hypothetical protein
MVSQRHRVASSRSDLSDYLIHFTRSVSTIEPGVRLPPNLALHNILREGRIRASKVHISRYCPDGAACFTDAPPHVWEEIIATNPSSRHFPFGIAVLRDALWRHGGRPVIYTDVATPDYWPEKERYRVVYTNLTRARKPVDWMHEREWHIRGELNLSAAGFEYTWWLPVVPNENDANVIWDAFPGIHTVCIIARRGTIPRPVKPPLPRAAVNIG